MGASTERALRPISGHHPHALGDDQREEEDGHRAPEPRTQLAVPTLVPKDRPSHPSGQSPGDRPTSSEPALRRLPLHVDHCPLSSEGPNPKDLHLPTQAIGTKSLVERLPEGERQQLHCLWALQGLEGRALCTITSQVDPGPDLPISWLSG